MKEDEALISEWLCSASPRPVPPPSPNQQRQTVKQVACSISLHPAPPPQSGSSFSSPLSILYLGFTERSLGTRHTKISTCGLTAQQGGSTIALQLHIGLAVRQPGTGRTADTNILITHGCEGFRGGDGSGVRACAAFTHSL